jgi:poly(ADP-ribose) glycohydrolase
MEHQFILPSSAKVRRQDRFDLVHSDEYEVPFWDLLTAILRNESAPVTDAASLIEALGTIAVTLRGTAVDVDFGLLRNFISRRMTDESANFFDETWPVLVDLALEMPNLFPGGTLPSLLSPAGTDVAFSRKQIACLVVHQFLCSLPPHPWSTESFVDLRPWYSMSSTVHQGAVEAYLTALFTYFERIHESVDGQKSILDLGTDEWPITFTMQSLTDQDVERLQSKEASGAMLSKTRVEIVNLAESQTAPNLLGLPDGACVISANKCIGYGPSGTQEELNVGISPEAYPAVLLAPPLSDHQVLICRGAEAMVSIVGYGRDAKLGEIFRQPRMGAHEHLSWRGRTMLFIDALELDVLPVVGETLIPDIYPLSRMSRDMILKAYNGFRSGEYSHVITGLWGCGTFGGNRSVKCTLQWCAATLAGVPTLRFVLSTPEQHRFGEEFAQFVERIRQNGMTVKQMVDALADLKDKMHDIGPNGIFAFIANKDVKRSFEFQ